MVKNYFLKVFAGITPSGLLASSYTGQKLRKQIKF